MFLLRMRLLALAASSGLGLGLGASAWAADTSAAQQLSHWSAQAGTPGRAEVGRTFFNQTHGGEWSCASCHGVLGRECSAGEKADVLAWLIGLQ